MPINAQLCGHLADAGEHAENNHMLQACVLIERGLVTCACADHFRPAQRSTCHVTGTAQSKSKELAQACNIILQKQAQAAGRYGVTETCVRHHRYVSGLDWQRIKRRPPCLCCQGNMIARPASQPVVCHIVTCQSVHCHRSMYMCGHGCCSTYTLVAPPKASTLARTCRVNGERQQPLAQQGHCTCLTSTVHQHAAHGTLTSCSLPRWRSTMSSDLPLLSSLTDAPLFRSPSTKKKRPLTLSLDWGGRQNMAVSWFITQ